jgi:4-amino-4-deoxy-L-arabinose transferase-like glycosyltransferase
MMKQKRWLLFVTALGAVLRIYFWSSLRGADLVVRRLPDDALYYFTIARNLAHGYGISFDALHPTNGMHPLWLFLITPFFAFGLTKWGAIHAVLVLQSVLDTLVVWLIGSTVFDALKESKKSNRITASVTAALLYAANIRGLIGWINGLETTLAALMLVVWLKVYLKSQERGSWWLLGVVTGLTLLARTDFFIVLTPLTLFTLRKHKDQQPKLITAACIALAVVAPWIIWNIVQFGTPLQSSAKAVPIFAMKKYQAMYGSPLNIYAHLAVEAVRNVLKPFWYSALGVPLLVIGFSITVRRKSLTEIERIVYLLVAGGVLLLAVHTLFRGFIRDWYVLELLPLFLLAFGVAIGANAGKTEAGVEGRLTFAAVILVALWLLYPSKRMTSQYDMVYRGIPVIQELTKTSKVASFNTGYYSYFATRPGSVVDLDGVVSAEAVDAIKQSDLHGYLDRARVDYVFDFEGDFGGYVNLIDKHMLDSFTRVARDTTAASGAMVLYRRMDKVN